MRTHLYQQQILNSAFEYWNGGSYVVLAKLEMILLQNQTEYCIEIFMLYDNASFKHHKSRNTSIYHTDSFPNKVDGNVQARNQIAKISRNLYSISLYSTMSISIQEQII